MNSLFLWQCMVSRSGWITSLVADGMLSAVMIDSRNLPQSSIVYGLQDARAVQSAQTNSDETLDGVQR